MSVEPMAIAADSHPKSVGLVWESQLPVTVHVNSSDELVELSQWLCCDFSTINIFFEGMEIAALPFEWEITVTHYMPNDLWTLNTKY